MTIKPITYTVADWQWLGHKQHYIGVHRCDYSLATRIGPAVISTIGDKMYDVKCPKTGREMRERRPFEDRGGHFFETVVFAINADAAPEECGCSALYTGHEWYVKTADTAEEARQNHMEVCRMVSDGELTIPYQQIQCFECGSVAHMEYQPGAELPKGAMVECQHCGESWIHGEEE